MTEELERLGGGDTRVGKAAICCCVASTATSGHGQSILKATSGGITVTDPRSAASTSCPKSKSFSVPCCLQSEASGSMICNSLGQVLACTFRLLDFCKHQLFSQQSLVYRQQWTGRQMDSMPPFWLLVSRALAKLQLSLVTRLIHMNHFCLECFTACLALAIQQVTE